MIVERTKITVLNFLHKYERNITHLFYILKKLGCVECIDILSQNLPLNRGGWSGKRCFKNFTDAF